MSKFFDDTMQGLLEAVEIEKESKRKETFETLEHMRKNGNIIDYDEELVSYRDEKYGN